MRSKQTTVSSVRACSTAILGLSVLLLLGSAAVFGQTPPAAAPAQDPKTAAVGQDKQSADRINELQAQVAKLQAAQAAALGQIPAAAPAAPEAMSNAADQNKQLTDQIAELRAQVTKLEAAVQQTRPGKKVTAKSGMNMSAAPGKGMGMKNDKGEMGMPPGKDAATSSSPAMGMKDGDQSEMGGMPPAGSAPMSPGMSMEDDKDEMSGMPMSSKSNTSLAPSPAMGMCCKGERASGGNAAKSPGPVGAGGMATMSPSSAIPGQAGVSHLYHIGSNGFFLNRSSHITLTPDQRLTLNHLKEKATLESASEQRRIDQGEQELYTLTGADRPDDARIRAKIVEIEKLRADQRMNFIRVVADASNVLTPEQRKALLGTMAAAKQ